MENLYIYNQVRRAPKEALKPITAGDLKGKSDISPQWRIEALTSLFGPCGFGWRTEVVERWTDEGHEIDTKNQVYIQASVAWVKINLYVRDPESHEWSEAIVGLGGSKITGIGRGGKVNEEAWKMAETDAISVACKKLGVAADVYWDASTTKYSSYEDTPNIGATSGNNNANRPPMPQDPYEALKWALNQQELNVVWSSFQMLSSDAGFITAINKRAAELNKK